MTIQELGSLGELIAAIATVATLAYLAAQIRAARKAMRAESLRSSIRDNAVLAIAADKELADVFSRGLGDLGSLEPVEHVRFTMIMSAIIGGSEAAFGDHALGLSSDSILQDALNRLRFLESPGGRQWWSHNKTHFNADFRDWLTESLGL